MDDENLAIDDYRVRPQQWQARLEPYSPNDAVNLLVARRERLQRLQITFGTEPLQQWQLAVHPEASTEQQTHLQAWLGAVC